MGESKMLAEKQDFLKQKELEATEAEDQLHNTEIKARQLIKGNEVLFNKVFITKKQENCGDSSGKNTTLKS